MRYKFKKKRLKLEKSIIGYTVPDWNYVFEFLDIIIN